MYRERKAYGILMEGKKEWTWSNTRKDKDIWKIRYKGHRKKGRRKEETSTEGKKG